ncbi:MAG: hypothetical protein LBF42_02115 [Puniceicoccales bacterium]|nr:hypothetical protein [Puniceicoccales bacterium]
MRLPIGAKLFFLVAASAIFAALLLNLRTKVLREGHSADGQFTKVITQKLKSIHIVNHKVGTSINAYSTPSGKWMCIFDGIKVSANQHAISELLSLLKELKFYDNEYRDFNTVNSDWTITLTDACNNLSRLKVAGVNVYLGGPETTFFLENQSIGKSLAKIYPELHCKKLFGDADTLSRLKFSTGIFCLSITQSGDQFKVTSPINRPMNGKLLESIVRDIFSLYYGNIIKSTETQEPLFALELDCGKTGELVEFYRDGTKFSAKKSETRYKFDNKTSALIGTLYSRLVNFQFFSGLKCDFISISSLADNRQISLQKLENSEQWQKFVKTNEGVSFIDVGSGKIRLIEDKVSTLSQPIKFDAKTHFPPIGKVSAKTNIGEFNFDIFKNPDRYILLNRESSLAFVVSEEFIENLYSLFDDLPL